MSTHFSRFSLNTYSGTPYFQAHIPPDYPLSLVLQKSRRFRNLPTNLRELADKSKQWSTYTHGGPPPGLRNIDEWYDDEGYELNIRTGERLTDEEIDEQWSSQSDPDEISELEIEDIPIPDGGFPDPETWDIPQSQDTDEDEDGITEEQLLRDIASHGREYVAREYGVPPGGTFNDKALARAIMGRRGVS